MPRHNAPSYDRAYYLAHRKTRSRGARTLASFNFPRKRVICFKNEERVLDALGDSHIEGFTFLQKKTGLSRNGVIAALLRLLISGKIKIEVLWGMYVISRVPEAPAEARTP